MDFVIRDGIDSELFLKEWRWLVPAAREVVLVSPFGDMILLMDGQYWFLFTASAKLEHIADSKAELENVLRTRGDDLLLTPLVKRFVEDGLAIEPGQCISFYPPIVAGGQYKLENARAIPAWDLIGFLGDLNRQIKDLPDGSNIRIKVVP
jgi:hypothetical protein